MRWMLTVGLVGAVAAVAPLEAQGRGRNGNAGVPPGHLPPAGQCRVWVDGVPPGRQAAPTDCATARAQAVRYGGRVIYGGGRDDDRAERRDDRRDDRRDRRDDRRDRRDRRDDRRDDRDDDRDARRGDYCLDRDRDGRCDSWERARQDDSRTRDGGWCTDRDGDGRCDAGGAILKGGSTAGSGFPTGTGFPKAAATTGGARLPEMIGTVMLQQRQRSADQAQWLGRREVRATWVDADRNRIPERIRWMDARGQVVQQWVDTNRDGRADYVQVYENGRLVATRR